MPNLLRVAPELPVVNLRSSIGYYESQLGFRNVVTMPDETYAIVERDGVAIHLFQTVGEKHSPQSIHIFATELDQLFAELHGRGARLTQVIVKKPWGNRDFRVSDEFGNELKFTEPMSAI